METILFWVIFGGIVGWLASLITGANRGIIGNIVVGILGALLGGWLYSLLSGQSLAAGFNLPSLLIAVLGSIILIWIVNAVRGDTTVRQ